MNKKNNRRVGVFYFSSIPFDSLKQRPQQIYLEWKNMCKKYDFFYVEPPSIINFFRKTLMQKEHYKKDKHIINIPSTKKIPFMNEFLIKFFIRKAVTDFQLDTNIAIICTPFWEPFISNEDFKNIYYDYIDSIEVHSNDDNFNKIKLYHNKLVSKSDLVFTTSTSLKQDVLSAAPNKKIRIVTNGVDPDFFEREKNKDISFVKNQKKIVGYIGAIYKWIDLDLVYKTANLLPKITFILIGPTNIQYETKPRNVLFLGRKSYNEIPSYLELFDVAIIPFKKGEIAKFTDPIKVYEYFSLGKPVVTTNLSWLKKLDGNLLKIEDTPERYARAIEFFLIMDKEDWKLERKKIAHSNRWSDKASSIINSIEKNL